MFAAGGEGSGGARRPKKTKPPVVGPSTCTDL